MYTVFNTHSETKQRYMCQRCGGQLIRSYDEINCLQCGAPHTAEGKLVLAFSIQEYEVLRTLQKKMLEAETPQENSISVLQ